MLLETMIRPALRRFMAGRNAWMVRMAPKRLTSKTVFMAWSEQVSRGPISPTPALQTAGHGAGELGTVAPCPLPSTVEVPEDSNVGAFPC